MANIDLDIINKSNIKSINLSKTQFKQIIYSIFSKLNIIQSYIITIHLVDEEEITKLNKKYLNKNFKTDVISFKSSVPVKSSTKIGDIFICVKVATLQANLQKISLKKEIINLTIHGLLHILDFNHHTKKDKLEWNRVFKKIKNIVK